MNEAFVEVNGVPTKVTTWGRWIEESQGNTNEIIILIPGNPGVTGFYKKFAKTLYERTEIPVWCVGHAGHNFGDQSIVKLPNFSEHKDLYGLKGQVQHKIDFFKKYVPQNAKVYLIAHSIGSYVSLEMLEHPEVKPKIHKAYLLFPTVEHMAVTNHGKFLNTFVRPIVWLILFATWIFTVLPNFIANFLLFIYMIIANVPRELHLQNIKDLLKPGVLRRVFFLAFEELDLIHDRNNEVIKRNEKIVKFYYGRTDAWAPEEYYNKIKNDIPSVDAELSEINHAFVFNRSTDVANVVAGWIKPGK
ncbi:unnamed protein product [Ceutorhynchus assimilis]|uniref:Lipid droplet-associated hydrolase n=1 Tax=Ceutorhynchus assimilis TaxID=467358 RepID=A0A9N9N3E8_9CUCU|nr:unnamed protein product [Ceutorhynchus assimilis]